MKLFRRVIALCCCFAIFVMGTSLAVYAQPNVSEDLSQYTVLTKSYETGEVTSKVILPENSLMGINPEPRVIPAIMPSTEAYEIPGVQQENLIEMATVQTESETDLWYSDASQYPYRAIGRIVAKWDEGTGVTTLGTGYLHAPDVVVTCAHVVWKSAYGWSDEIWFYPGQTFDSSAYRPIQTEAIDITIPQSYINSGTDDWAIFQVEDNLGHLGSFGTGEATSALVGIEMTTSGYRADLYGGQYRTVGYVEQVAADYDSWIIYLNDIDTAKGHSGAPIYDDEYISWGIFGFGIDGTNDGGGRAVDTWLFNILLEARQGSLERWGY